jgi:hypothetical protein
MFPQFCRGVAVSRFSPPVPTVMLGEQPIADREDVASLRRPLLPSTREAVNVQCVTPPTPARKRRASCHRASSMDLRNAEMAFLKGSRPLTRRPTAVGPPLMNMILRRPRRAVWLRVPSNSSGKCLMGGEVQQSPRLAVRSE